MRTRVLIGVPMACGVTVTVLVYVAWTTFRDKEHLWFAVNDGAAEGFVYANRPKA